MTEHLKPALVWFRYDLRLADNPALHAAAASKSPLLCLFIYDTDTDGLRPLGAASRWWLHHSLAALDKGLREIGSKLHTFKGPARAVIAGLIRETKASSLYFNRRYEQAERAADQSIVEDCAHHGVDVHDYVGSVLNEPWEVTPKTGGFYKVFSPYWKAALARDHKASPVSAPRRLEGVKRCPGIKGGPVDLAELDLLPTIPWDEGLRRTWQPGEASAHKALASFVEHRLAHYAGDRDRPGIVGSSRLSPHLRFGEVSPRQVVAAVDRHKTASAPKFKMELGWRDFDTALLFNVPDFATVPFHKGFEQFPYIKLKPAELKAWQQGRTGYPIVDAGMRQLWQTGVMHNRVRMITASFLIKHLLADWRHGEQWFWDTLVDADPANNPVNWQWVAGCGNDPVPYFRIFNPVLQGEKFDADGAYIRQFVPELDAMPDKWIQKPWEAPKDVLHKAGVELGKTYPKPMVDHAKARARALEALKSLRAERG